jgi:anti-sigma factor RsiW
MNVTREIVRDLLPLYVAGEVSGDSRAAVEEMLKADPELAAMAAALAEGTLDIREAASAPAPDRALLQQTQTLIRRRTWFLAAALFFTGLPLSCVFDDHGLTFLLLRDAPVTAGVSLAVAVVFWVAFAVVRKRLRVSGL